MKGLYSGYIQASYIGVIWAIYGVVFLHQVVAKSILWPGLYFKRQERIARSGQRTLSSNAAWRYVPLACREMMEYVGFPMIWEDSPYPLMCAFRLRGVSTPTY